MTILDHKRESSSFNKSVMVNQLILLEFKTVFPDENYLDYLGEIHVISPQVLIDFATTFLRFHLGDEGTSNLETLFGKWFGFENAKLASGILYTIHLFQKERNAKVVIINEITSLMIMEAALGSKAKKMHLSGSEFEILIFKIYLAYNQKLTEDEEFIEETTKSLNYPQNVFGILITQTLKQSDIIFYNLKEQLVVQMVKAIYFFEEIIDKVEFRPLLIEFYKFYEVKDYVDFMKRFMALCVLIFKAEYAGKIDLVVQEDDVISLSFLEKLSLPDINIGEDIDFGNIRSHPLIKVENNKFRIIFPLFVIEKLYNGLYFKLRDLNENLPEQSKIINLRSRLTFDFSEKSLLYKLIERSYGKKYIQKSGELIRESGIEGFVDFYIRNGRKVFLFESKDILINAVIKNSNNYPRIEEELKKKLYYEERDGRRIQRAILQLINSIRVLLDGGFSLDGMNKPKSLTIYPIIVLYNRQLEILGLNQVVKSWFRHELLKLRELSYDINNVKDVVIMNVDNLILYSDKISNRTIRLEDMIDRYNKFTDISVVMNRKFNSLDHRDSTFRSSCITFSEFLRKINKWEKPKIFDEMGKTLFSAKAGSVDHVRPVRLQ